MVQYEIVSYNAFTVQWFVRPLPTNHRSWRVNKETRVKNRNQIYDY